MIGLRLEIAKWHQEACAWLEGAMMYSRGKQTQLPPKPSDTVRLELERQKKQSDERLAALTIPNQPSRAASRDFERSEDYSWVKIRGSNFTLTRMQAQVVGILHEAYERGKPGLGTAYILKRIERETSRLRDTARSQ
jgi:hypothetical protein